MGIKKGGNNFEKISEVSRHFRTKEKEGSGSEGSTGGVRVGNK